jgi:hypothetical protein
VAADGELVLLLARDAPLRGHDRGMLAHRQPGAGFGVLGYVRDDLLGADLGQRLQPGRVALGAVEFEQDAAQILVDRDRRVGGRVESAGDPGVDLPERDLVCDQDRGLEPGAAGLLNVVRRRVGIQARAEHGFHCQVEVAAVLEDAARGDLAEGLALERELADERLERGGQHVLVRGPRIGPVLPREWDSDAAEHCHPAGACVHVQLLLRLVATVM